MRRHIAILLVLLMVLSLCACGGAGTSEDVVDNFEADSSSGAVGLEFESNGDGTCVIVGIGTCTGGDVVIPKKSPDGDLVTGIGRFAFSDCDSISSLTISDSEITIAECAFYECAKLVSVTIEDSTVEIGESAFCGSDAVKLVIEQSEVELGYMSFYECKSLSAVSAEDSVVTFCDSAFSCSGIETLDIEDCSVTAGEFAFSDCENLVSATIEGSSVELGEFAFTGSGLETFSGDGGSISIDESAFWECMSLVSVSLDFDSISVADGAFSNCVSLETVTLTGNVKFGDDVFSNCENLRAMTIDGDAAIGDDMFYGCPDDLIIDMGGTEFSKDWEENVPVTSQTFTVNGISITLTDEFEEGDLDGHDAFFFSDTVGVVVDSEAYTIFTEKGYNIDDVSLVQYAQWLQEANEMPDSEIADDNGIVSITYSRDNGYTYYLCVYKGPDSFVRVTFYTQGENYDAVFQDFVKWAGSVAFVE